MHFDQDEGAEFLRLVPGATLFPLSIETGLPTGSWGALEAGEKVRADDPRQGYGIACGERSGGLVVLDVDMKDGKDGEATLRALCGRWGPLPPTLTVESPSGGRHLYFKHPGKFQSNAGKIGVGLDVRAEGGYVRIPGSPHPRHAGRFEMLRAVPPAMLPPAWADHLPRYGETSAAPIAEPLDASPDKLRDMLASTSKGKRGPLWAAWRAIARGERFVRVRGGSHGPHVPDQFGGVDEYLTKGLFHTLACESEEWARVSPAAFLGLFGPSLSILQSDDERAGNPAYTDAQIAGKWERATAHARSVIEDQRKADAFVDGLVETLQGALPLIVNYTGSFYVRPATPGPAEYMGPKVRGDLWLTCRDLWRETGPDVYRAGRNGPVRMSTDDLAERFGRSVDRVVHDTNAAEPRIEARTLVLPAALVTVEPVYHEPIERWLRAYDPTGTLENWIAIITDLDYAAPALWLTGEGGIGKSLLAAGLARIWGAIPTPMAKAFAEFNDSILRCPLVEAAEEIPRNHRGFQDTEKLKDLITETERKINEKHKPIRDVHGAVRVIMSSNNTNLIRNSNDLTSEDAAALAARFVHLHVSQSRAAAVRAALPPAKVIQDVWIGKGWIAEHAVWLAENRKVPFGPRLRMAPHSEHLRRLFVTQPGAGFLVCAAAYAWIVQAGRAVEAGQRPMGDRIAWYSGTVCTTADAILARMPDDSKRPSRRSVGQTLRRFSPTGERVAVRLPDGPRKLWPIELGHVQTWCESEGWGDPDELEKAVRALDAHPELC